MNSKYSIITVTYNAEKVLEKTIQSIIQQTAFKNIEYIVVDGASKDGTLALIKQYEPFISNWISEPDKGLYDAMNKALALATGDYVWFINAGDEIYSATTLEQLIACNDNADILYGETEEFTEDGETLGMRRLSVPEILTWKSFKRGMLVCHQSILVKRSLAKPYNTTYKLAADIDWVIHALKQSTKIKNAKLTLSRFAKGGISGQNIKKGLKERFSIMCKHYGYASTILNHFPIAARFFSFYLKNKRI